ncbi:ROK family protein [Sinobaca sp. H24]|uniref:ROK family protein n=1 Tax=Sinobaca sp. H24 TaxID=2923376 RepID=UPI00207AB195|nr:ROK family protein [Sinobaca sp. H24]
MTSTYQIAIDLGGTSLRTALIENKQTIKQIKTIPTPATAEEGIKKITEMIDSFGNHQAETIGCGAPGPLDPWNGVILDPPNLPGWHDFAFKKELEAASGLPVTLDNDANAAAVAEHQLGAGKHASSMIYITISTGIGAGIIIGNSLLTGALGAAGEVGLMRIGNGESPSPRNKTWEQIASGTALKEKAVELYGGSSHAGELFEAYRENQTEAVRVLDPIIEYQAAGIANIYLTINPELIVLGGGVIQHNPFLVQVLEQRINEYVYKSLKGKCLTVQAEFEGNAGVIGAGLLSSTVRLG